MTDVEMTTREAAAYLSERTVFRVNADILYGLRALKTGPLVEKRGRRLVYTRERLDAFLREFGMDPRLWHTGYSRAQIAELRARGIHEPAVEELIRAMDPDPDGWDPDDA